MSKITNVITLSEYAELHGLDVKRLRRVARKNEFPGNVEPFKFGNMWAIDATAPAVELPAKSARGTRRPDGRQRYIVYVNPNPALGEIAAIETVVGIDNVIDPRIAAKSRRDARKMADAVDATVDDDNG